MRKVHETYPLEMTRAWRSWSLKAEEIARVEDEEKRLGLRQSVKEALRLAGLRGGAAIILGLPGDPGGAAPVTVTEKVSAVPETPKWAFLNAGVG